MIHPTSASCVAGCDVMETARHLFLKCGTSLTLWYSVCSWLGLYLVHPFESYAITTYISVIWRDFLDVLMLSCKVSGILVFGLFGRIRTNVFFKTSLPIFTVYLTKLSAIHFYG
ncbi:hypothetical protein MtrunA17_Chr5g0424901 [Medicago truncatula]|uniref:Transmembrane protein n=1 Tax=Medicago truncatula TaxID=3880 RepID=A0A396HRM4_MEDTR|nr:hypothetical protein MtrunA17_Chr5g0424901 [Medicago truncatula]